MDNIENSVAQLLQLVPHAPGTTIPGPAAAQEIQAFQERIGYEVPRELRAWLNMSNGPCVGPGGLFGTGSVPRHLSIGHYLDLYPDWRRRQWLPVAGDGCGNYYVLVASSQFGPGNPVIFVEPMVDSLQPTYVAASNLWVFIDFLLRKELSQSAWPFNAAEVVERDPEILRVVGVPLPWAA